MLKLTGTLLNIFKTNDFTKEDGTVVPGKTKVQLLVKMPMRNGQSKNELHDGFRIQRPERTHWQQRDNHKSDRRLKIALRQLRIFLRKRA